MSIYKNIKVSVVGDVGIDNFVYSRIIKVSDEAPVLVVRKSAINNITGLASNVASNIRALGAKVQLSGVRGNDYFGSKLESLVTECNIENNIIIDKRPTIVKSRYMAQNHQLLRVDTEIEKPIRSEISKKIVDGVKSYNPDIIVISDYAKGTITAALMDELKSLGKPIIANPKPQNIFLYDKIDTVQLNKKEADAVLRLTNESANNYVSILKRLKLNCLIITRGSEGIWIYTDDRLEKIEAVAEKVVDPCGCGDTALSVIALERYFNTDIIKIGMLANEAAASVIKKLGTHVVDLDRLLQMRTNIIK